MKYIRWIAISGLTVFLLLRGIVPAMEGVGTDFPNYYTSARLLVSGADTRRIYDDDWFQEQIQLNGINQPGKFSPFPPVTAFVLVPFAFASPLDALRMWTVLNFGLLAYACYVVAQITNRSWYWGALLFLLTGHALANNFRFGQFYLVLTLLVLSGYRKWIQGEATSSGVLLAIGTAVKYFPALFLVEFIVRRERKIIVSFVTTLCVLMILGIAVMGPAVHVQFLRSVLGPHLQGNIQDPFSPTFQSWNSLFRRLFLYDSIRNPNPFIQASFAYVVCLTLIYGAVVAALMAGMRQASHRFGEYGPSIQFALIGVAGLLLLPASATYHFLLLVPSVAILLGGKVWNLPQKILAVLYSCIGFIPFRFFDQFASSGIFTVMAYPRLMLMTGLFTASVAIAWKGPEHPTQLSVES